MPEFPTEDWFRAYIEAINASEEYAEYAATWEGDVIIQVEAEPGQGSGRGRARAPRPLARGMSRRRHRRRGEGVRAAEFAVRAPYSRWKDVIHGDLEPIKGLVQGKLRVRGDLPKILRYVKGTQELAYIAGQVDTTFPDDGRRPDARRGLRRSGPRPRDGSARSGDRSYRTTRSCGSRRAAICGSDLHLLHGKAPMEPGEPLGHEAVGVVEAVGDGVERVQVGDRVGRGVQRRLRAVLVLRQRAVGPVRRRCDLRLRDLRRARCRAHRRSGCVSPTPTSTCSGSPTASTTRPASSWATC